MTHKILLVEWLRYAVSRVPTLAGEVKSGKVAAAAGRGLRVKAGTPAAVKDARPAQLPALFDFARQRRPVELAVQPKP